MAFAVLAWANCIFSLQGYSQDLFTGSGMRRHASCCDCFLVEVQTNTKLMSQQYKRQNYYERIYTEVS